MNDKVRVKRELARQFRREMTSQEAKLWQCVRGNRLGGLHFRRQEVIAGFIVDFYCLAAKLVVELDGSAHFNREEYDTERDAVLNDHGLVVIRYSNTEVETNIDAVLSKILIAAQNRLPKSRSRIM